MRCYPAGRIYTGLAVSSMKSRKDNMMILHRHAICKKTILSLLLALAMTSSGCGKSADSEKTDSSSKDTSAAAEEITDTGENSGSPEGVSQSGTETKESGQTAVEQTALRESLGKLPERLNDEFDDPNTGGRIIYDADIALPELESSLPLFSAKKRNAADLDVSALAGRIFDPDSYSLFPKAIYMSPDMLSYWEEKTASLKNDSSLTERERIFFTYEQGEIEMRRTGATQMDELYPDALVGSVGKDHDLSPYQLYRQDSSYRACRILGKIDGRYWILYVEDDYNDLNLRLFPADTTERMFNYFYLTEFAPGSIGYGIYNEDIEQNRFPRSEAESSAWELVDRLQLEDFAVSDILPMEYTQIGDEINEKGELEYDGNNKKYGWAVHFSRCTGNMSVPPLNMGTGMRFDTLYCVVTEDGYIELDYGNAYDVQPLDQTADTLLPFDSVISSANHYFQDDLNTYDISEDFEYYSAARPEFRITHIQLAACYAEDQDGNITLVPAWYFCTTYENYYGIPSPLIIINALDGSLIQDNITGGVG